MLRNRKIYVIGRVAQDFRESSLAEIVKTFTDHASDLLDAIENDILPRIIDGNVITVDEKNRLWACELGSEYAEQPVAATEVEDLIISFYVDSRKQCQRTFV